MGKLYFHTHRSEICNGETQREGAAPDSCPKQFRDRCLAQQHLSSALEVNWHLSNYQSTLHIFGRYWAWTGNPLAPKPSPDWVTATSNWIKWRVYIHQVSVQLYSGSKIFCKKCNCTKPRGYFFQRFRAIMSLYVRKTLFLHSVNTL